ncbi:MAG: FAD-dependent oxidoreductase [Chloroflexi bacterium]|nr:FAD-dependent oxidoreductase [Chloroflexota bacterium]
MSQFTHLFAPGRVGSLEVKNRLVMAAMGTFTGDSEGFPNDSAFDYYVARAQGGVGLIISGAVCILWEGRRPGRWLLHDDKFIPRLRQLADAVHERGGKMAVQLIHHGMTHAHTRSAYGADEIDLVGPSAVPSAMYGVAPRAATLEDIQRLVEAFSDAARRVRDAGFDGVEFHGAHGHLISEFLSPFTNRRIDDYGGTPEKRARFACEIIERTRRKVGRDFPIIFRMNGSDYLEGGTTIEDALRQASILANAGADALHISASAKETTPWQFLCHFFPDGAITHLAEAVKKVVKVPVITVGKIGDPLLAEQVLQEGEADFVAMGRALLADPDLPNKARDGRLDEITRCIYCNNCVGRVASPGSVERVVSCTVNPALLREREFALKPAERPRKVMVVGGGLAGVEAAVALAQRGHNVSLYEKSDRLGGQWNVAARQPSKVNFDRFLRQRLRALEDASVQINLKAEVTKDLIREQRPDAVVVATGASPIVPAVPGARSGNVVQAIDVFAGKVSVGERVVVVGGRERGMEVADLLAGQGKQVSLATRTRLGRDVERNLYLTLRDRLIGRGVRIYENAPLYEIKEKGVYFTHNRELLYLPADTVVLAMGAKAEDRLAEELKGLAPELHVIGDCAEPRDALMAIADGARVGRLI